MIPASTSYLLKKVKFGVKNEAKCFYQTNDHYVLFLDGETQNFLKNKEFLLNTILKEKIKETSTKYSKKKTKNDCKA